MQRAVGKNGSSISELLAIHSTKARGKSHSHNALPQCWLTAVGAPASAIIWRKDPVHIPGGDRPDLMETCKATWPWPLMWYSSARSGFCSESVSCFWLYLLGKALDDGEWGDVLFSLTWYVMKSASQKDSCISSGITPLVPEIPNFVCVVDILRK